MSTLISVVWKMGVIVGVTALVTGCARFHEPVQHHAGSIKDGPITGSAPARQTTPAIQRAAHIPSPAVRVPVQPPPPAVAEQKPADTAEKPKPPASPIAAPAPPPQAPDVRPTEAIRSATPPPQAPITDERTTSRQLLEEGRALFAEGKVVDARRRFIAALSGASPEATWALAQSFDTHYLAVLPANDGAADPERAQSLYKTAIERGAKAAQEDLDRITAALEKPKQ